MYWFAPLLRLVNVTVLGAHTDAGSAKSAMVLGKSKRNLNTPLLQLLELFVGDQTLAGNEGKSLWAPHPAQTDW